MEKKLKHLEMLQAVISRMARNSFLLKGWNVVLVSAIFALASTESKSALVFLAYLPATVFWLLDGYFLRQERLFRKLYDKVRSMGEDEIDFSMNTSPVETQVASWLRVTSSRTLLLFHGAILLTITAVWLVPAVFRCI
ncbi:MAG: hypothetical protein JRI95_16805 [Deltaproteobacteria bacterium]|nr:hypothetical protein [Deltaproteobacteria bacterium]